MESSSQLPAIPADAKRAYAAHRSLYTARRRWLYSLLVLFLATVYESVYFLTGRVTFDGELARSEYYPVAFLWLGGVALLGAAAGCRARAIWFDVSWMGMLLAGMVMLAILDSADYQVTAYVLISLPAAILYSAPPRRMALLHGLALGTIVTAVLATHSIVEAETFVFVVTLGVCFVSAVYVGMNVEKARHEEFLAARALAGANDELGKRSLLLADTNARLEAGNQALAERSEELARANTELLARGRALEEANRRLEQLAMTDPLTGVANRRLFFELLDREFARARRHNRPLAVAVVDLDDFGLVNKLHGVIAGDEVLGGFATVLREHVRGADVVGRYGGEEFVVLMPDSAMSSAEQLIERVREHVAGMPFGARALALSFSAGVTMLMADDADPMEMLNRADEAMRRAKTAGKNRVLCA